MAQKSWLTSQFSLKIFIAVFSHCKALPRVSIHRLLLSVSTLYPKNSRSLDMNHRYSPFLFRYSQITFAKHRSKSAINRYTEELYFTDCWMIILFLLMWSIQKCPGLKTVCLHRKKSYIVRDLQISSYIHHYHRLKMFWAVVKDAKCPLHLSI